jgi:hypothetical protein
LPAAALKKGRNKINTQVDTIDGKGMIRNAIQQISMLNRYEMMDFIVSAV